MTTKINKEYCPEDCNFFDKKSRFCGYCLKRILKKKEEKEHADGKDKTEGAE